MEEKRHIVMRNFSDNYFPCLFYEYGKDFLNAAILCEKNKTERFIPVLYFLYCKGIEVSGKAFLLSKGKKRDYIKKDLGHNIIELIKNLKEEGIDEFVNIKQKETRAIEEIYKYYRADNKGLEYANQDIITEFFTSGKDLPTLSVLKGLAEKLVDEGLCKYYKKNS